MSEFIYTDILGILSSKPHNRHYLNRYVKFIISCKEPLEGEYYETHHICPKAKDLFPEYTCLVQNPWNSKKLSARCHFIAHRILRKVYGGSQTSAFRLMLGNIKSGGSSIRYTSRLYEDVKKEFSKIVSNRSSNTVFMNKDGELKRFCEKVVHTKEKEGWTLGVGELRQSSKGKIAVNKNSTLSYIKPEQLELYLEEGWKLGYGESRISPTCRKVWVNNGISSKMINSNEVEEFIENGWFSGRIQKVVKCPHCEKQGVSHNMRRYHFDNCKHKGND